MDHKLPCQNQGKSSLHTIIAFCQLLAAAVALAFEAQMVPRVPTASHDIDVDILATAQNLYACSSRGKAAMAAASPA